jgi:3-hydroxypropanoate dehydrogenase
VFDMTEDVADKLFAGARCPNRWSSTPVTEDEIRRIYELMKWGPTSANCSPARFAFVSSPTAKARLVDCVSKNNQLKVQQAPVTAIIGMDEKFADHLPLLYPHVPSAPHWFVGAGLARDTALRNSSLQGAYFMLAARLMGIDCGPMSGFDNARVDALFFSATSIKSNFICALGHGTTDTPPPRLPRLKFDDVAQFV